MKNIADYKTSQFSYDPLTGLITNAISKKTFDTPNHNMGYIAISTYHKTNNTRTMLQAHRLAWFLYYGTSPTDVIDHIDGDKTNNKITNLQVVTQRANMQNRKRQKNCTYLPHVVRRPNGNFQAQGYSIRTGNKIYFGSYNSELDAHYTATYYKLVHHANYKGADLTDINGLPHPFFTGTLATIMQTINDTSGNPALIHMHK